jgi:hypothetical protein
MLWTKADFVHVVLALMMEATRDGLNSISGETSAQYADIPGIFRRWGFIG